MRMHSATEKHHIVPIKTYLGVAAALFVLTVVTVAISYVHLGGWNVVVALSVAAVKGLLVALIFMHLKYDKKIYMVVFIVAILFLAVFITLTLFDTLGRGQVDSIKSGPIEPDAIIYRVPAAAADSAGIDSAAGAVIDSLHTSGH